MKRKEFLSELENKDAVELYERARGIADERLKMKVRHATGQLEMPHRLKESRRDIARILTKINEVKGK